MPDLPREILREAGLILDRQAALEERPRRPRWLTTWKPRLYAQQAHEKDFMRSRVYDRDGGICARCGLNCCDLRRALRYVKTRTEAHDLGFDFHFSDFKRAVGLARTWRYPKSLWDAHMIVPKSAGGNDHDLTNFLTLCLACHRRETNQTFYPR